MKDILKYIEEGIIINGNPRSGYRIFTVPTQHFDISSLDELTPAKFEEMIKEKEKYDKYASELIKLMYDETNKNKQY